MLDNSSPLIEARLLHLNCSFFTTITYHEIKRVYWVTRRHLHVYEVFRFLQYKKRDNEY
jgi:hypothetical protein